jgi:putative membrane protein
MSTPTLPPQLVSHWQLAATLDGPAAACVALYLWGTWRGRDRWPVRRTVSFVAGVGCVLLALQSGLGTFDDRMLSAHMAQHMLLLLLAPVLLLGGRPVILTLRALPARSRRGPARLLARARPYTGPVPALGIFCAVVVLTHLPWLYDATLRHPALHDAEHILYLAAGLLMWSPLLDGDPAPTHRLDGLGRLIYLIVAMLPMALVGAYLNRHPGLVYAPYGAPAHALGISAPDDQAQAGAIMWVLGDTVMVAIGLWTAIAALVAEERRQVARDARAAS